MPEYFDIYEPGPIKAVPINYNIALWTEAKWKPFRVTYTEGIPQSSPFTVDMCQQRLPAGPIAAGGTIANTAVAVLGMNDKEVCHYRWYPLDDLEGGLWELGNMPRFNPFGGQARTSLFTEEFDPYLATTTFFILGQNKNVTIGAWNLWAAAQPTARFSFFGWRYIVEELPQAAMQGPIVYIPAQGR